MFLTPLLEVLSGTPLIVEGRVRVELLSLTKGELRYECDKRAYASGDFAGLGDVRTAELYALCRKYRMNCSVVDESEWQDGPAAWDVEKVAERIEAFVKERRVAVIFTFDRQGASGHPNHISVHKAATMNPIRSPVM
ncbi:N-ACETYLGLUCOSAMINYL-PH OSPHATIDYLINOSITOL DE-N-ACETYLASE, putative [Babesia bigemina]|uniref:N-acetylglucosaminylphosphatidylinositol deacetylase n=1 Tax=Babesia bigemina TaxID=5866 RepID=A0A061DA21_BABBI|nr:N-ACETYLGLUCOSAMINYL-PH OSPHATIDYLINOSITOL DE-N-ACETYLASE, putative [Babesia bigemina]CDR96792.1 N-ACETYLGLUCOSAMINYL-PH OSPHATIDYLINOSITOL DE-N-ACETYLASE, putative [Babesia bigemina]|eukprot:XP_012768978.1 N-ACETYLGLUCOSAMINYL-PH OSPHATIDYLINOSITOL DE-N-ACETYLASE, putative [Babesia bigemina]